MLNADRVITIEKNQQVKMHIHYAQIDENWSNIRTQINIKENAQLDLTESYAADCRINHVAIINAGKNARLTIKSNKLQAKTAGIIHYCQINCDQGVSIEQQVINNDSRLSHSIQDVNFNGEQGYFKAASVNIVEHSCHIAENIQVNHLVKNCKSEVICRSLAKSNGQIALNAKAVVSVAADGSDISQSLKNILLSDEAKIYSRPELEINTDDVIAAHGSTTGELDELALTYLRSRGIPKLQAQTMLIESFLQDANIFNQENFLDTIKL
jgi:Fe-S cluster assembly protein SufD